MADLKPGQTKKYIYVNSRDRQNGTEGNFNYKLSGYRLEKVDSFYVDRVNIPYSFDNISQDLLTDRFTLFEDNEAGTTGTALVTLTNSQYTIDDIFDILPIRMAAASDTIWGLGLGNRYAVEYQAQPYQRNRIQIRKTSGPANDFRILWETGVESYMYRILGFNSTDTTLPISAILQAPNTINFNISPSILVRSNTLTYNNSNIYKGLSSNVILSAPLSSFQEVIEYSPNSFALYKFANGSTNLVEFDLTLTFDDDLNNPINMNGVNWSAVIVFIVNSEYI